MKKFMKKALGGLLIVPAILLSLSVVAPVAVHAADCDSDPTSGITGGVQCAQGSNTPSDLFADGGIFRTIVNILLYIVGAIAVIVLIIGGIRYVTSGGDSSAVTAAKNTILYAIIGIIVAILAYAIVNFVLGSLTATT